MQQGTIRFRIDENNELTLWVQLFEDQPELGPIHLSPEEAELVASKVETIATVLQDALRRQQQAAQPRPTRPPACGTGTHMRPDVDTDTISGAPTRRLHLVR